MIANKEVIADHYEIEEAERSLLAAAWGWMALEGPEEIEETSFFIEAHRDGPSDRKWPIAVAMARALFAEVCRGTAGGPG